MGGKNTNRIPDFAPQTLTLQVQACPKVRREKANKQLNRIPILSNGGCPLIKSTRFIRYFPGTCMEPACLPCLATAVARKIIRSLKLRNSVGSKVNPRGRLRGGLPLQKIIRIPLGVRPRFGSPSHGLFNRQPSEHALTLDSGAEPRRDKARVPMTLAFASSSFTQTPAGHIPHARAPACCASVPCGFRPKQAMQRQAPVWSASTARRCQLHKICMKGCAAKGLQEQRKT